jgi:hypothetical protein
MRWVPWIVGGGALAYVWKRGKRSSVHAPSASPPSALEGRWVWPVPTYQGRRPVISDGFDSPRAGLPRHGGVDLMFARQPSDPFAPGTPNGSKLFVMPDDIPALAASDGVVWSATKTPQGFAVVIDHGPRKVATFYTHLEQLLVAAKSPGKNGERVRAAQPIGIIGASPRDAEHLKHLHFEVWLGGPSDRIDPARAMSSWETVTDPRTLVARNGSLVYRQIGASGERYPAWVRELDGKAGVYIIRDGDSHEILYVGSSSGRLYDTLTRHFQQWRRAKTFWKGYASAHDPGVTYDRGSVEVAVRITSPSVALDEEMRLISRLAPRDNLVGQRESADETVPF